MRNVLRGLLVPALLLAAGAAAADPVAFVVSLKGTVTVIPARSTTAARASLGKPLERGDKVQVGPRGSASLFFSDGNVVELGAGSSLTVGGRLAPAAADRRRVGPGADASAEVFSRVSKFITSRNRQSGLVALSPMRGSADEPAPIVLAPRRSALLTGNPDFQWRSVTGATRYQVTVATGTGTVWTREVSDTSLGYPADAPQLPGGADYAWTVRALSDDGPLRDEESTFRVLSSGEAGQVREHLDGIQQAAGDTSAAGRYLAGSYLVGRGLYVDATREFEALARLDPGAPGPHEALGDVYRTVGLPALAEREDALARRLESAP